MTGMKIRFARSRSLASIMTKGTGPWAVLFLLALAVPMAGNAQEKPGSAKQESPVREPLRTCSSRPKTHS